MQINPSEISELIKSKIQNLRCRRGAQRGHGDLGHRRHLPHPRPGRRDAGRDARVPRQHLRPRAQPRARLGRRRGPGRVRAHHRGRHREVHRPHPGSAGRPGADRPRGQFARPADRRQGPDQRQDDRADREGRAGRDRAQVGVAAGADRPQVHRRDGADRPRPARADHRRPPDRQDRGRGRHDHQPEGQGPLLHLRRRSARRPRRSPTWCASSKSHGAMAYTIVVAATASDSGRDAVHRALLRLHHGRVLPRPRPGRADHLRRPDQAGLGVPPDLAAAAPPAGPRGVSGRRVLPALAPARARRARERDMSRSSPRARSRARPARSPRCR